MERRTLSLVLASIATAATIVWIRRSEKNNISHDNNEVREEALSKAITQDDKNPIQTRTSSMDGDRRNSAGAHDDLPPHVRREIYKEQRRKEKIPFLAMKSPMYDNIIMRDARGVALSTISNKKAQWYVTKQLAEWTTPSSIQLRFEPSGRSDSETYTSSPKSNCCVACGAAGHMMRHYIVPYAYRSMLPQEYKSHQSHDIVILCPNCHLYCEQSYHDQRNQLEDGLRTDPSTAAPNDVDPHKQHIRSAALALLRWKGKLPKNRIDEYESIVREHLVLPRDHTLSAEQLQIAIDVKYTAPNPRYISGAELVANHLIQGGHESIAEFVREWRTFFLETVQPRHLPIGWRVDAPVMCTKT